MKKVFLLFALFVAATGTWAATMVQTAINATSGVQVLSISTADLQQKHGFVDNTNYENIALNEMLTLSSGKYYKDNGGILRYYQKYNPKSFTIQAKAGVIIQTVKFTYYSRNNGTLAKSNSTSVTLANRYVSGTLYAVDANSFTCYFGNTSTGTDGRAELTNIEIKYFVPETGVAVTKSALDLGKDLGLKNNTAYQDLAVNNAITLHADNSGTMKYYTSGNLNFYRWTGPFYVRAREGAKINYVKITYTGGPRATLTKTYGSNGKNISKANRILSDSILYVNSNELRLYIGDTLNDNTTSPTLCITKIYVNYTDASGVVVENYKNCTSTGSTGSVNFAGVDGNYNWTITNFSRNTERMYYDQATKLNKGGKISTPFEGGLKEAAFDWHPSEKSKATKFKVTTGSTSTTVDSAAMTNTFTINFKKTAVKQSSGTFSIEVDANSGTTMEFGPISLTPYLLYTNKSVTIAAKDYASKNFKYTNTALINNTAGEGTVSYAVSGENASKIASIDAATGEVSILGEGTVTVTASWEQVTTTYQLTITLENANVAFAQKTPSVYKTAETYTQTATKSTSADLTYEFVGEHDGATIDAASGKVDFTKAGTFTVKASAPQTLPYKAGEDTYTLTVNELPLPTIQFEQASYVKDINDQPFINPLTVSEGAGALSFVSSNESVATVVSDGTVTIVGAGTTTIKAKVAQSASYAADSASYIVNVLPLPEMSFAEENKNVYLNAAAFTNELTISEGAGAVSYESDNTDVATVNATSGEVTIVAAGVANITAKSVKSETYSAGTKSYALTVSTLKLPTASYSTAVVNKNQNDDPFTNNTLVTESDGVKHFTSSDTRVATVNETTGEVTMGEKPGTTTITVKIDASATWEKVEASYTLNVSGAPIADLHKVSSTITALKNKLGWADAPAAGQEYTNIALDDVLTLSSGKHLYENVYGTGKMDLLRYYQKYAPNHFTIQAKAGVIIQTVKFTYKSQNTGTLATKTGTNIAVADRYESGTTYKVDANSFTCYFGNTGSGTDGRADVTEFEITYFDPATGVAVTKMANDLGKDLGLINNTSYKKVAVNNVISVQTVDDGTLKYYETGSLNCYRWKKNPIRIVAREGATIHYVKVTYSGEPNGTLTKYYGTDGQNIPAIDRIASDSILYVNANSLSLWVGNTNGTDATVGIQKIYVNYTDGEEVVVDNFDNCTSKGSTDTVEVAGVDGKYDWTISNFARDNAQRMYYDQSIKLNKGGKIATEYTGGLKEVAFDWHPSEKNQQVKFYVIAGGETITVDSAAMADTYTINFQKTALKSNGEFAIAVDANSATTLEIGHVSLTPYLLYAQKEVTIAAKDYKDAGWKYNGNTLTNYTGKDVEYTTSNASIASIDATTGEVTIQTGGTVTISATADGATASYQLTINLEVTEVEFAETEVEKLLTASPYQQELTLTTAPESGNVVSYAFVGDHEGATIDGSNGTVTFTATGVYTIMGKLAQQLPYAADSATYKLTVTALPLPGISFAADSLAKDVNDPAFINALDAPEGVGAASYSSSDEEVATVAGDGTVTIVAAGKAIIKVVVAESASYAADSASYIVNVLPLPEMSFAAESKNVYLNAAAFTNELTISEGAGAVSYESSDTDVATVDANGQVTIVAAGTANITAKTAKNDAFSAGTKSYTLTVSSLKLPAASFAEATVNKNQSSEPFTNALNKGGSDGAVTYSSNNAQVATVDANGQVTLIGKNGTAVITATIAATATWETVSPQYTVVVNSDPLADMKVTTGNVPQLATLNNWVSDKCYTYFKLDDNISISSTDGNAKYLKAGNENCLRYYHKQGTFTIRAKAGVIIKAVKFNYYAQNDGVIASTINATATEVPADKQLLDGVTYPVDGSVLTFYSASTSTKTGTSTQIRVTGFEVTYFDPSEGVTVTKKANDLGKDLGLVDSKCYQNVAVNNVITLHADSANTMRYSNDGYFNCYRWCGPITIKAREGATIHYVKVTYTTTSNAVLTKYFGSEGKNIPVEDRIASDSIIYVNADSLKLYVGSTASNGGTASVKKIYVNYTDKSEAIVDNFDNCTKIYGGDAATKVMGVDSTFEWEFTQFNRDSLRRIGYDQSTMLRQNGGKIAANNEEGGVKEFSFDWFASDKTKGVKFYVKAGGQTFTVDSAATNGYYFTTFTKTGIKSNGAFSIEVDQNSGSQLEVGHVSLTPYLLYKTKSASMKVGETYTNTDMIDNRDSQEAISYSSSEESVATVDADGKVTAINGGTTTITATWGQVSTTYTVNVNGLVISEEDPDLETKLEAGELYVILKRVLKGGMYNTIYLPFAMDADQVTAAFGEGMVIAEFTNAILDGNKLTLEFDTVATALEARTPYLIKPKQDINDPIVMGNVTIVKEDNVIQHGDATLMGVIPQSTVDISKYYFLMADNTLKYYTVSKEMQMNGLRAFFQIGTASPVQARCVFGRGGVTELPVVNNEVVDGTQKMIIDNQFVIIRDGKMFDAQGQVIR